MRYQHFDKRAVLLLMCAIVGGACAFPAYGDYQFTMPPMQIEARIYQVLTNVTGDGLTSQTLPGPQGWLQVVHQRLDDVVLVMEGETLTWNGEPVPSHDRILPLAMPKIAAVQDETASVAIGNEGVSYMERRADGLFELKKTPDTVGLRLSLTPVNLDEATKTAQYVLDYEYAWVKDRAPIDGVNLEVGSPVMGHAAAKGSVQLRLGDWSCYQAPVESEGWIYLFLRITPQSEGRITDGTPASEDTREADGAAGNEASGSSPKEQRGPKVEVGGTFQVRGSYYSGKR